MKCGARTNFGERAVIVEILLKQQQPRQTQVDVVDELVQVCEEACRASVAGCCESAKEGRSSPSFTQTFEETPGLKSPRRRRT